MGNRRLGGMRRGLLVHLGILLSMAVMVFTLSGVAWAANIDLQVSAYTWTPDPVVNGSTATFTLTVQNNGPASSAAATLTVALPSNVTYVGNTSGCSYSFPNLTCPVPMLALGESATVVYTANGNGAGVQTTTAVVAESPVTNTDTNSANDTLSKSVTSIKGADLAVTKTGPGGCTSGCTAVAGAVISFEINVTNNGPDPATGFRVTDNLPATSDFTYGSASGSGWTCSHAGTTVTCDYNGASVASGTSTPTPITVTGTVITSGGTITNGATVASTDSQTADYNTLNDTVSRVVTITAGTNLRANKSMVSSATGLTSMVPGEAVTLTLSATNTGTQQATGISVTDTVPADFTIGALPGGCTRGGQLITCTIASLNSGATSSAFVIPLTVAGTAGTSGSNTANVSRTLPAGGTDTPATTNYTIVSPFTQLTITKTKAALVDVSPGNNDPVQTGQKILNTITVTNSTSSTSAATGTVTVVEYLDSHPNETFDALTSASSTAGWSCTDNGATVTCTFPISGSLTRGASLPNLVFTTNAVGSAMTLTNHACTGGTLSSHSPADNDAVPECSGAKSIYSTPINIDIGITKTVDDNAISASENSFTYTIKVHNYSVTDTAPTVVVTDAIPMYYSGPAGTTGIVASLDVTGAGEGCTGTSTRVCTLKNIPPGGEIGRANV